MRKPVWSWSSLFRRLGFNVSRRSGRKTPGHHKHRPLQFEPLEVRQFLSLNDLSGLSTAIIDDQATGYSEVGTGWLGCGPESGAYNSAFRYHAGGDGSSAAVYTFDSLDQGAVYQVFATWHESGNRASNSLFSVYDGNGSTPLGTHRTNQKFAPDDAVLGNQNWESLGAYTIESGSIVVRLSDAGADGYIIADAVCIAKLPASTALVTAIDDGDAAYSENGGWLGWSETAAADGDLRYCAPGDGSSYACWTFENVDPAKYYQVVSTWSASGNRSQESPFTILDGDTTLAVRRINQQFAADDVVSDGRAYESLGVYQATSGTLKIYLSNDVGSGYVVADKIRLEEVQTPEVTPTVIDDGDIGFLEHGDSWRGWSETGALNGDFRYAGGGTGNNYADWQFADLSAGKYNVYATWHGASNRATNSLFSVVQGQTGLASTRIDQTAQPSGTTIDGQTWQSIGQVTIEDGTLNVRLSDSNANGFVIADGAKIELVDLAPTIGALQGGPNPNSEDAQVILRASDVTDDDGEITCVKYYRDTNNDGILEPDIDQLLATDNDGSDGWAVNVSTAGFGHSNQTIFAQATDNEDLTGNVAAMPMKFSAPGLLVMDSSMQGYVETGEGWTAGASSSDYFDTHREHTPGGNATATWTFENLAAGYYKVYITYTAAGNLASNAPFKVYDNDTLVGEVSVDQRAAPGDDVDLGASWKYLGKFHITQGKIKVELSTAGADGIVAADAVRIYDPFYVYFDTASGGSTTVSLHLSGYEYSYPTVDYGIYEMTTGREGCWDYGEVAFNLQTGTAEIEISLDEDIYDRLSNDVADPDVRFAVFLSNPQGCEFDSEAENYIDDYGYGGAIWASVTLDDDVAGAFVFDQGDGIFTVEANHLYLQDNNGYGEIAYSVDDGSAEYGTDYVLESTDDPETALNPYGTLGFSPECPLQTFAIVPLTDGISGGSFTIGFTPSGSGGSLDFVPAPYVTEYDDLIRFVQQTEPYPYALSIGLEDTLACFAAGTPVLMADGNWKKIEEVRAGDKVLSVTEHDAEGPVESKKVIQAYNNEPQKLLELYVNGELIRCTYTHRFYARFKGWTPANELELGDQLKTPNGRWLNVSNKIFTDNIEPVFNIHVADNHTYFVSDGKSDQFVLVHNAYAGNQNGGIQFEELYVKQTGCGELAWSFGTPSTIGNGGKKVQFQMQFTPNQGSPQQQVVFMQMIRWDTINGRPNIRDDKIISALLSPERALYSQIFPTDNRIGNGPDPTPREDANHSLYWHVHWDVATNSWKSDTSWEYVGMGGANPNPAVMWDAPELIGTTNDLVFETAAFCPQTGEVLGVLTWGFKKNANGTVIITQGLPVDCGLTVSDDFKGLVARANGYQRMTIKVPAQTQGNNTFGGTSALP
jgi:hypothetical protein